MEALNTPYVSSDGGMWDYHQRVAPRECRQELVHLSHTISFAEHLGVRKTME